MLRMRTLAAGFIEPCLPSICASTCSIAAANGFKGISPLDAMYLGIRGRPSRFPSLLARARRSLADVRFTLQSGQSADMLACPLCAKSGLMHCSKSGGRLRASELPQLGFSTRKQSDREGRGQSPLGLAPLPRGSSWPPQKSCPKCLTELLGNVTMSGAQPRAEAYQNRSRNCSRVTWLKVCRSE